MSVAPTTVAFTIGMVVQFWEHTNLSVNVGPLAWLIITPSYNRIHHSATVHMTTSNDSDRWRKAVSQHMQTPDAGGEGDHYPWKIYVNQRTGETIVPPRR